MAMSGGSDDGSPMMEINTTPLIDVMLVLLIMFIITIPVATHSIDIDLPAPQPPTNVPPPKRDKNVLSVDSQGTITWNGTSLNESGLVYQLTETLKIKPEPELQFQPEEYASYEIANRLLKIITQVKVSKFGFVGNENFATFSK